MEDREIDSQNDNMDNNVINPFNPKSLFYLFLRPSLFFSRKVKLDSKYSFVLSAYFLGISMVMGRIDIRLLKTEINNGKDIIFSITDVWFNYWVLVIIGGVISGYISWLIWGWWYGYRARLCGYNQEDKFTPRLVFVYSSLVENLPFIILTVIYTIVFDSYTEAFFADDLWSLLFIPFLFLSCFTSYVGVKKYLHLSGTKTVVWFLVLPLIYYFSVVVGVGFIVALVTN